ncbi:MAG: flavin-containing monooxygenase [Kineosporiaceae bacterium]
MTMGADGVERCRVLVVGAGFGGLGAAFALRRAGYTAADDVLVLDAADRVGGVWRDNHYPGCACDIPATLYCYSYAPNPGWSRRFPPHGEIRAYLEACVDRFGVRDALRLGTSVEQARWDDARGVWQVDAADGRRFEAQVLVPAVGQLSRPVVPTIPGLAAFAGPRFHTARWDDDVDLRGRRVGVLGTGASAIQVVPAIAGTAACVTVFQRTPPWTLPKPDRRYSRAHRAVFRHVPGAMRLSRLGVWAATVVTGRAVRGRPVARRAVRALSVAQRRLQVPDPTLRAEVTPDYPMGCKRVLYTSTWYPTLRRPDVELVTAAVAEVTAAGVRTADGVEHPCDVLVLSTGFAATQILVPLRVTGREGRDLHTQWSDGAHAHLGMTVPGFPNLVLLYGPNTNTGNTSVVYFLQAQAGYLVQALELLGGRAAAHGPRFEVRADVEDAYDREIQARLADSVWTACSSWYRTPSGRVVTNWPGSAGEYRRRTARLHPADFTVATASAAVRLPAGPPRRGRPARRRP